MLNFGNLKDNLWTNPAIKPESLTDEQKDTLKKSGQHMYGQMDFDDLEKVARNAVAPIVAHLKSGVSPAYLSQQEKDLMENVYGSGWEKTYTN